MTDDYELVRSPLCQEITIDDETIEVAIYRGADDTTWSLEVVDDYGNSTVWDDEFESDEDALKEVLRTIEEEGIEALIGDPSGVDFELNPEHPIDRELHEWDDIACSDIAPETAMDASTLEGFFTALILGPYVIPTSQYMPWVWDLYEGKEEVVYDSVEQAQETMNLLMAIWNNIAKTFSTDPAAFEPAYFRAIEWGAAEWCEGFLIGSAMFGDAWTPLWIDHPELETPFMRLGDEDGLKITLKEKDGEKWMNVVPDALVAIHAYWLENRSDPPSRSPSEPARREHDIGRNDPCPCGSGKKFKKCCGAPPTVH